MGVPYVIVRVWQYRNSWADFQKSARLITSLRSGPHPSDPTCKYWGQSVKGGVKLSPSVVYFFLFLSSSMRIATGRPVGLIVAEWRSNDATWWRSRPWRPFVVSLINNYFSLFSPKKCEKLHYTLVTLWQLWRAIECFSLHTLCCLSRIIAGFT